MASLDCVTHEITLFVKASLIRGQLLARNDEFRAISNSYICTECNNNNNNNRSLSEIKR